MSFLAAGAVVVGVAGAAVQADAAGDASRAQVKGNNAAIAEQRRQFDLIMQMLQPQRQIGLNATNALNQLYGFGDLAMPGSPGAPATQPTGGTPGSSLGSTGIGITPTGGVNFGVQPGVSPGATTSPDGPRFPDIVRGAVTAMQPKPMTAAAPTGSGALMPQAQGAPNFSGFFASPDYGFRRSEGNRNIENSFAAGGGARSGNALRALTEFNSNLASQEYGNYFNRLAALAGFGQTATGQGVGAAQNTGNNIGNAFMNSGNARASGIANQSNAWTNMLNQFGMIAGGGLN